MNYKYYYGDTPLSEYCKKHPEYRYNQISKYISVMLRKDPTRSIDDIINEYMNKSHKSYTRYIINGMNLSKYCRLMNISYDAVTQDISRSKKNLKYKDISEEELISMIIEKHMVGEVQELDFEKPKKLILTPEKNNEGETN